MYNPYYNPYLQPQQNNQQYNDLLARLNAIEGKSYATQTPQHTNAPQGNSSPVVNTQPAQAANTQNYILVDSEQAAWDYAPDMSGKKQVFYNETKDEFYTKLFNANVPKTYKTIYKPVDAIVDTLVAEVEQEQNSSTETIVEGLADMTESVDNLTGKVDSLIEFIKENPFVFVDNKPKSTKAKKEK